MLRVPTRNARPGMVLAMNVQNPHGGAVLLTAGFELERTTIARLRQLDIHDVWVRYPDCEMIRQYVSPAVVQEHGRLVSSMARTFETLGSDAHAPLEFRPFRNALRDLIERLVSEPTAASYIAELGGHGGDPLRHGSEVCFLSLLIGLKLQGYLVRQRRRLRPAVARRVLNLGVGAMLHDVGLLRLPPELHRRCELGFDEDDARWREHVEIGHRLLSGAIDAAAAGIVLNHHQHFDGSGFPARANLAGTLQSQHGQAIHVFSRIVCVTDHFDRLRHGGDGPPVPRVRVLRQMLLSRVRRRFDPVVLGALLRVVPAYPPGSSVRLSTGHQAIVVGWDPASPCRPVVRRIDLTVPHVGSEWRGEPIDLATQPQLTIVEHDGADVSGENFEVPAALRGVTIDPEAAIETA
jgi:hypothetical protein